MQMVSHLPSNLSSNYLISITSHHKSCILHLSGRDQGKEGSSREDRTNRGVEKGMEQEGDGVTGGEIKGGLGCAAAFK